MRRVTLRLLLAALFGVAAQLLFYREIPGLNVFLALGLYLAIAWRLRSTSPQPIDLWMPAFALAFAGFVAIRTDEELVLFDVLAATGLALATTTSLHRVSVTTLPLAPLVREAWLAGSGVLWRTAPLVGAAIHRPWPLARAERIAPYAGGLLLAVLFLLVFVALFAAADAVFAKWWSELVDIPKWWERLGEARDRTIVALVASWTAGGALTSRDRPPDSTPVQSPGPLAHTTATVFLGSLAILFIAFVGIQIAYLFGGSDTMEAAGITYSEYARRGFFELLLVAGIVAATLFGLELLVGRGSRLYVTSALALIALTGAICASAVLRLDLYQRAYGWSELRLYAFAALAAVGASLVIIAWAIVRRRMTLALQPIAFVALVIALIVNAIGPSGFIARANVSRLLAPDAPDAPRTQGVRTGSLDRWYLVSLGQGAVPDLVALRGGLPETERFCLDVLLYWRHSYAGALDAPSWQGWNLDRERARQALRALTDELVAAVGEPRGPDVHSRFSVECERPRLPPARP